MKISKFNLLILLTPISTKEGVEISNLLLGMSYNMPNMLSSEFQSHSIKISFLNNFLYHHETIVVYITMYEAVNNALFSFCIYFYLEQRQFSYIQYEDAFKISWNGYHISWRFWRVSILTLSQKHTQSTFELSLDHEEKHAIQIFHFEYFLSTPRNTTHPSHL